MKTSSEDRTPIQALSALHESASLRAVTGQSLRPGGFLLTDRALSLCGFEPEARIIDVGCGTGASVSYLRGKYRFRAWGFDISGDLFQCNENADMIPLSVARAEELPLTDDSCDGVLCECVLSLVKEPLRAVGEFSRVLRPGGFLMMSDLYDRATIGDCSIFPTPAKGCLSNIRTRRLIEMFIKDAELRLIAWEDHTLRLKELAAQLILNDDSCTEFTDIFQSINSACAAPSGFRRIRPGYFLLIAQKMT